MDALLEAPLDDLLAAARERRRGGGLVTFSPKVFIPLTTLCRDVCGYCTFARPPRRGERAYLSEDEVLAIARAGAAAGCTEALFTLGDKPELRYKVARAELAALGCATTLEYLGRGREARARRDGPAAAPEPRRDDARGAGGAPSGLGLDGDHARDGRRAACREGRPALGLAGQAAAAAAGDDRARRRAADPVHERDPDRDRRDTRRAARGADRAARPARAAWPPAGGDRPELPRQARDADGVAPGADASTTSSGRSPRRGCCSPTTSPCRRRRTSPTTTSPACSTRASTTGAGSRR